MNTSSLSLLAIGSLSSKNDDKNDDDNDDGNENVTKQ